MPKQLFTAADIQNIGLVQKSNFLLLGPNDIITPEAVDVARELGIRLIRENPDSNQRIDEAKVVSLSPSTPMPLHPLKMVFGGGVIMDPFGEGLATPGTNVRLKDVITSADGSPMAAGYMALDKGEFPWSLSYDEVDIILEGELVIKRNDITVHGKSGDVIFIPKGSGITFGTPTNVRFIYVAFPANWNELA